MIVNVGAQVDLPTKIGAVVRVHAKRGDETFLMTRIAGPAASAGRPWVGRGHAPTSDAGIRRFPLVEVLHPGIDTEDGVSDPAGERACRQCGNPLIYGHTDECGGDV
jgi:hypothetical protein